MQGKKDISKVSESTDKMTTLAMKKEGDVEKL